jgi:eukaryotic-like serine/threonine-protein kinase
MPFRRRRSASPLDAGAPPPGGPPLDGPPPEETPPERELWPWLLAFLILVLGGLAAAYVLSRDDSPTAAPATSTETRTRLSVPELTDTSETTTGDTTTGGATTQEEGTVDVPRVVGLRRDAAAERLAESRLESQVREVFADRAEGIVVRQRPRPEQQVDEGTRVLLEISKGPPPAAVPEVTGVTETEAKQRLNAAGFPVNVYDVPAGDPKGTVLAQEPKAGEQAPRGSVVRINVSTGVQEGQEVERKPPANVAVPDLVGQKRRAAIDAIRREGLRPDTKYVPSSEPADTVVAQSPRPGTTVKRGSGVRVNVSKGPQPKPDVAIPDVVGKDEPTATAQLERAGFVVEVVQQDVTDPAQDGIVIEQSPVAGERAPRGSVVTLVVGYLAPQ